MDKSIDDQLIREAREDGASRERIRIRDILRAEHSAWQESDEANMELCRMGATAALANVLCRIDGLLPPRGDTP